MKPKLSYVICAVQRSGSFLLCEALKNTNYAGIPEEHFVDDSDKWSSNLWARRHGNFTSNSEHLEIVLDKATTPNGVFGTKIMWNYFQGMCRQLKEIPQLNNTKPSKRLSKLLPNLHYIWMLRRDKIQQAVSWALAWQTGVYANYKGTSPKRLEEPTFSFNLISNLLGLINEGESGWSNYFEENNIDPIIIFYEDLVQDYEGTALKILDEMNISYPPNLIFDERKLLKQSNSTNKLWLDMYNKKIIEYNNSSKEQLDVVRFT